MNNIFLLEKQKEDDIHFIINSPIYKTVTWSVKQKLIYKMKASIEFKYDMFSEEEKKEFKKLFENVHQTPNESLLKKCLLVIVLKCKPLGIAIGLKVINRNNYIAFKSVNVNEIIELCRKHHIIINYDRNYAIYLYTNAYINEIIPENIWEYTAHKYLKIMKRNRIFSEKIRKYLYDVKHN